MPQPDSSTQPLNNQKQNHQVDASPIHFNFDLPQPVVTHTKKAQKAKVTLFPQQGIPRERGDEVGAMTHADLGRRFNLEQQDDQQPTALFDSDLGKWRLWADGFSGVGGRWIEDDGKAIQDMSAIAEDSVEVYLGRCAAATRTGAKDDKLRRDIVSERNVASSLRWASSFGRNRSHEAWDHNPLTLGTDDGQVINLRTQETRPGRPSDMVSKSLGLGIRLDPDDPSESKTWNNFLWESLGFYPEKDRPLVLNYLKKWLGYSLTASVSDQSFLFLQGKPSTGKSTLVETWKHIMGDYGRRVDGKQVAGFDNSHREWLARISGARVVAVSELPERGHWNTREMNSLTTGEGMLANFMRKNSFEFNPVCKIIVSGNARPGADPGSGIWRRLRLIRFECVPSTVDANLGSQLRFEAPGILRWALNGLGHALTEMREGNGTLAIPHLVQQETQAYRSEQNSLDLFVSDSLSVTPGTWTPTGDLYAAYQSWAVDQGIKRQLTSRSLGKSLVSLGYTSSRTSKGRGFDGLEVACR